MKNKSRKGEINKLARQCVAKYGVEVAGTVKAMGGDLDTLWWSICEQSRGDFDRLKDAIDPDWRQDEKKDTSHYDKIKEILGKNGGFEGLILAYDDAKNAKLSTESEVWFSLGFATAIRLLGL